MDEIFNFLLYWFSGKIKQKRVKFYLQAKDIIGIKFLDNRIIITPNNKCIKQLKIRVFMCESLKFNLYYKSSYPKKENILLMKSFNYKEVFYDNKFIILTENTEKYKKHKAMLEKALF